jgi:hypothetical protein
VRAIRMRGSRRSYQRSCAQTGRGCIDFEDGFGVQPDEEERSLGDRGGEIAGARASCRFVGIREAEREMKRQFLFFTALAQRGAFRRGSS